MALVLSFPGQNTTPTVPSSALLQENKRAQENMQSNIATHLPPRQVGIPRSPAQWPLGQVTSTNGGGNIQADRRHHIWSVGRGAVQGNSPGHRWGGNKVAEPAWAQQSKPRTDTRYGVSFNISPAASSKDSLFSNRCAVVSSPAFSWAKQKATLATTTPSIRQKSVSGIPQHVQTGTTRESPVCIPAASKQVPSVFEKTPTLVSHPVHPDCRFNHVTHPGVGCDNCGKEIRGVRWKCVHCPDYDLCSACEEQDPHVPYHAFLKVTTHASFPVGKLLSGLQPACPHGPDLPQLPPQHQQQHQQQQHQQQHQQQQYQQYQQQQQHICQLTIAHDKSQRRPVGDLYVEPAGSYF